MNIQAVRAYREFLEALGLDLQALGMTETPIRVAELYETLFEGIHASTADVLGEVFESDFHGLLTVQGLRFHSLCEHHLLPFFGTVDVVYQPAQGRVAGLSKVESLVKALSRRPQLQERLTEQIAVALMNDLQAEGAWVRLRAKHLCMTMKGESSPDVEITTVHGLGTLSAGGEQENRILQILGGTDETISFS